jgi:hypothetical protein
MMTRDLDDQEARALLNLLLEVIAAEPCLYCGSPLGGITTPSAAPSRRPGVC